MVSAVETTDDLTGTSFLVSKQKFLPCMSETPVLVRSPSNRLIMIQSDPKLVRRLLELTATGVMEVVREKPLSVLISNFSSRAIHISKDMYIARAGEVPEKIYHIDNDSSTCTDGPNLRKSETVVISWIQSRKFITNQLYQRRTRWIITKPSRRRTQKR